jgi:hypothetical protein
VNPDASHSFAARDGGQFAPHGSGARGGSPDNADWPLAGPARVPLVHNCRRNNFGHGRSSGRHKLEPGSVRTEKTATFQFLFPLRTIPDVDANGNEWNNAPTCVLSTV